MLWQTALWPTLCIIIYRKELQKVNAYLINKAMEAQTNTSKFTQTMKPSTDLNALYESNGYVVLSQCIDHQAIDRLLKLYREDILPSNDRFFRQNTNQYQQNQINKYGYVQQAFLDAHGYKNHPAFSKAILDIFCNPKLHQKFTEVTKFSKFHMMQSMFFDQNAATAAHQDWWYLDSVPNGHLFGVWVALQDIEFKAGQFYMIKKSQNIEFHKTNPKMPHSVWQSWMENYVNTHPKEVVSPTLKKGDVIIWNSRLIHGAFETQDESLSRKSVTAHFLPESFEFGNLFTTKRGLKYTEYNGVKIYKNQPDYSRYNEIKYAVRTAILDSPNLFKLARIAQRVIGKINRAQSRLLKF